MNIEEGAHLFILRDGAIVRVAPVMPEDRTEIMAFLRSLSQESRGMRFRSGELDLNAEADLLVMGSGPDRVALKVTSVPGKAIMGHGCLDRLDVGHAEANIVVADAHQRRGIGRLLLRRLADAAAAKGIRTVAVPVTSSNRAIVECVRASYPSALRSGSGGTVIEFATQPLSRRERARRAV